LKEKPPSIGSVSLDEQLLRKLFQKMDCRMLLEIARMSSQKKLTAYSFSINWL
jgi:hypothetical protein